MTHRPPLRSWQKAALDRWMENGRRGIAQVVTGGGKTYFAFACIQAARISTVLIVVPSIALLDQWWEEAANALGLKFDEVHVVSGKAGMRTGTVNIAVLNTAAKLVERNRAHPCLLIVDECHKAASPEYRSALAIPTLASLGLSATPDRPYDDGLQEILEPKLGAVFFTYSYQDAAADGVIVPFELRNLVFEMEPERQKEYERLTGAIARSIAKHGIDGSETVALLLKRARVLNLSLNRVRLALKLVAAHPKAQSIVFHEDIEACELIHLVLRENGVGSGVYHSGLPLKERALTLSRFRSGDIRVLVTCRALDEGFNVPEAELGIIAASTATRRQRIQRLGRVLRPSRGKTKAIVYTLVATAPEIERLRQEEKELEGVSTVEWARA